MQQVVQINSNRSFLEFRDTNYMSEYNPTGVQGLPKYYGYWDENTIVPSSHTGSKL
jgi:hypothetical protein